MTANNHLKDTLGWRLGPHAREQCIKRGISTREVLECIALAEASVPGRAGRLRLFHGDLEVVACGEQRVVVTAIRHNNSASAI